MQFNKLYNLILQSIITQNKAQRVAMIQKCDFLLPYDKKMWIHKLDDLNNNKLADFLCKYVANRQLDNVFDGRIQRVKKILQLNPSIDTQSFKGELSQFVLQHLDTLKKHQQKQAAKSIKGLDSIKQFTKVKEYPNGVVIYRVQNDEEGMKTVRRIVDAQWGKEANPWCLISRGIDGGLTQAWSYWKNYDNYPKHIAFQNGKLLAFSANSEITNKWWDRNDKPSNKLKLLDGSQMKIPKFQWSEEYLVKKFLNKHKDKLEYIEQTGRYDVEGNMIIQNEDIINGHYPIKFGIVTGTFRSWYCKSLTSLEGAPIKVGTHFNVSHCPNLKSLVGAPEYVGDDFLCEYCNKLKNLIGCPKKIGGIFTCNRCKNLSSLQGAPEEVGQSFDCSYCPSLKSLQFAPKKVGRNFSCINCNSLQNLIGAPKRIECGFNCWNCQNLKSLQGAPEYVGSNFDCNWCESLKTLKGCPRIIKGRLDCHFCTSLTSLQGGPDEVILINNYNCDNLKLTEQDKQKYKIRWINE